jgi:hypothetical protein
MLRYALPNVLNVLTYDVLSTESAQFFWSPLPTFPRRYIPAFLCANAPCCRYFFWP